MQLATYKFYDNKKRRLSIFARKDGDSLEILVIPCSKKDKFIKRKGRDIYETVMAEVGPEPSKYEYDAHVLVLSESNPRKEFIEWCKKHYMKQYSFFKKEYYFAKQLRIDLSKFEFKKP